jgi:hypothetical protein
MIRTGMCTSVPPEKPEGELRDLKKIDYSNPAACPASFGSIKQWMNQGAFLMRGLENMRAEFILTALVYNLRRALNILGVEAMMAAVRG